MKQKQLHVREILIIYVGAQLIIISKRWQNAFRAEYE